MTFKNGGSKSAIDMIITPRERDLGGFSVRRVLPSPGMPVVGPWIFFDHMGPVEFPPGQGVDVRPHPHINLATVTYLFEGEILHRDSLGNEVVINPGAINLMVAGKGIVHSERQRPEVKARNNRLHGLQLWLGLPEADEEIEPEFHHYDAAAIPQVTVGSVPVRVMIGSAYGVTSPVKTYATTLYVEASLQPGQRLRLPDIVPERAVYVTAGKLRAGETVIDACTMAVIARGADISLQAESETRLAIVGGEPLGKRHVWWNFASSRAERIEQAKADWRARRFPIVPGDEQEFIPLPAD